MDKNVESKMETGIYSIWKSMLGSPCSWELPDRVEGLGDLRILKAN